VTAKAFGGFTFFPRRINMTSRLATPALLMTILCISAAPAAATGEKEKDEAAIRQLAASVEKAHNAHDAKALAAVFAADGDFTSVKGKTAHGRKAIEELHRPMFEGDTSKGNPSFKEAVLKVDEVRVRFLRPDVASVDILWTQTGSKAPDGKDRGTRQGLMSWVVTQEDGTWQVTVMHNMDLLPVVTR
jgi:uncharacterized protein (TIGR02246 family)